MCTKGTPPQIHRYTQDKIKRVSAILTPRQRSCAMPASSLLKGRRHGRKGAFSCQKDAFVGGRGAITAWNGEVVDKRSAFSNRKGAFAGGKTPT